METYSTTNGKVWSGTRAVCSRSLAAVGKAANADPSFTSANSSSKPLTLTLKRPQINIVKLRCNQSLKQADSSKCSRVKKSIAPTNVVVKKSCNVQLASFAKTVTQTTLKSVRFNLNSNEIKPSHSSNVADSNILSFISRMFQSSKMSPEPVKLPPSKCLIGC